ncbi:MAG: bifunctional folylpolyglutamate synthase/dihydrofolate synthase, partial [bacterium]
MDSYRETVQYLYNLQFSGIKLGLQNVSRILNFLGDPQHKWPAIHIAGTNGKGSTAAFIFSMLQEAGLKVGLYTSPHLVDFSERIRINQKTISWNSIVEYTRMLKKEIDKNHATFFEATSAIAFQYFADNKVDIAVIETGLGGRLDATNLVLPKVTVITPVGLDHQQYLGDDLVTIAREKAGIIKESIPCVTNNTDPDILALFNSVCISRQAPFYPLDPVQEIQPLDMTLTSASFNLTLPDKSLSELEIKLTGEHQLLNAALAVSAILKIETPSLTDAMIRNGLVKAVWPGRMQVVRKNPYVVLDVAHNPEGFSNVLKFFQKKFKNKQIWTIIGLAKDKDFQKIADILSRHVNHVGIVDQFSDRALPSTILMEALEGKVQNVELFQDITEAYEIYTSR